MKHSVLRRYISFQEPENLREVLEMLVDEIEALEAKVKKLETDSKGEPAYLSEAFNSGDGTYRP